MRRHRDSWSGLWLVALMALMMVAASVAIPLGLHERAWIEGGLASIACWLILVAFISAALYVQPEIEEDNPSPKLRPDWSGAESVVEPAVVGCTWLPEGCVVFAGIILLICALVFVFELLIPALIVALFLPMQRGIQLLIDRHPECSSHLGLALGWATAWSTVVVGPVTVVVCALLYAFRN